jgi:hypothetical protein
MTVCTKDMPQLARKKQKISDKNSLTEPFDACKQGYKACLVPHNLHAATLKITENIDMNKKLMTNVRKV